MSKQKQARLGPRREPGGRPERPQPRRRAAGTGRWSARRKVSVVLELLRGADLESVSRRHGVTAAKLVDVAGRVPGRR